MNKREYNLYEKHFQTFVETAKWETDIPVNSINDPDVSTVYSCGVTSLVLPELESSNNFMKMLDKLMLDEVINRNYTRSELINKIISAFSDNSFSMASNDLYNTLKQVEKEKYYCIMPVYGFVVTEPVVFGNVMFAPGTKSNSLIAEKINISLTETMKKHIEKISYNTVALMCIKSSSKKKAIEISEEMLRKYLNIFRVFIGSKSRNYNISVENSIRYESQSVVFNEEKITFNNQIKGAYQSVLLNDSYFTTSKYISLLIELLDVNKKKSNIEKRLSIGVQLLGEAFLESDTPTRFLKSMMAIEALIQVKGESTKEISLKAAYLLGSTQEETQDIYRSFNKLYDLRSRIAHGEIIQIGKYEEYLVLDYTSTLLVTLIDRNYENFEEFEQFVFNRKTQ